MNVRSTKLGLFVFGVAALLSPLSASAQTTYYVSTSGSDANWGTQGSPVRTIQRGVALANKANAAGQAVRILIAAGTYRESVELNGQSTDAALTIEGAGATTILSGADVWSTGWTSQGDGSIVHAWPYKWGMKALPNGWGSYWNWDGQGYKRDMLRRSEMVYINGSALRGVRTLAENAAAGTFFVDEAAALLRVRPPSGVSLTGATIEIGMRVMPLKINARRNVTLKNFAVMRSRGAVNDMGFSVTNSRNITLDGMTVRWFAYGAIGGSYNNGFRIYRSTISDNGVRSIGSFRDVNVLIQDSEIARNNWRGYAANHIGWDTGNKWTGVRDGVIRHTKFLNNFGHGFWIDTDNKRITLENNVLGGNRRYGVWLENNQGPITIIGNRICNNSEADLADGRSDNVTVKNNQIFGTGKYKVFFTGTYAGRTMTDWQTGASITNHSRNWTVDGNIVSGSGTDGWLWVHTDYQAPGAWADIRNTMTMTDNNRWYHSARTTAMWLPQGKITYSAFRTDLKLANSLFEAHSVWQAPSTLSCTLP